MPNEATPIVRTILKSIRTKIQDGTYRPGQSLPPELDIALELRVSRGSVRKAIELLVETREIERRRYARPIIGASRGPAGRQAKDCIHVWVAQTIREDTSVPFLQGVSRELLGSPYRLAVHEPSYYVESVVRADERKFLEDVMRQPNVAGAIIWRDVYADQSDIVSQMLDREIPLVFVDSKAPGGLPADHVGTANTAAARQCVERLINLGHRRIVCVTDTDKADALNERVKGFWRAVRQAGLDLPGQTETYAKCVLPTAESGTEHWNSKLGGVYARFLNRESFYSDLAHGIVMKILAMDPLPTALFVTYDVLAFWVWAILEGQGVQVPKQMSIVGFDWRAQWDKSVADELDTARQDFEGFGRHAVELLLDRIAGEATPAPRHVLLDAPLVIRSSTSSSSLSGVEPRLAFSISG